MLWVHNIFLKDGRNGLIILGVAPKDQKGILDKIHKDIGMTTYRIMDEETELDEGQLKDMLAQAGDIEYYAKRSGGIDKKDMMKAASLLKKGNKSGALNFVSKLDTSPREKILDLMGEEVELDEKMKPVDPKTAKMIAKIIARNILDYNFEYGLSRDNMS